MLHTFSQSKESPALALTFFPPKIFQLEFSDKTVFGIWGKYKIIAHEIRRYFYDYRNDI